MYAAHVQLLPHLTQFHRNPNDVVAHFVVVYQLLCQNGCDVGKPGCAFALLRPYRSPSPPLHSVAAVAPFRLHRRPCRPRLRCIKWLIIPCSSHVLTLLYRVLNNVAPSPLHRSSIHPPPGLLKELHFCGSQVSLGILNILHVLPFLSHHIVTAVAPFSPPRRPCTVYLRCSEWLQRMLYTSKKR